MATRSTRNALLAVASGVGVVAGTLRLVAQALAVSQTPSFYPTYLKVAPAFDLASAVFWVAAFGVALAGFLQVTRHSRVRLLAASAALFAGYGIAFATSTLISTIGGGSDLAPEFMAAGSAAAAAGIALAAAAALVSVASLSPVPNAVLGRACLGLVGYFALLTAVYGLDLAGVIGETTSSGRTSGGIATGAVGQLVAVAAAAIAASAFLGTDARRERALGLAAGLFALGFLLTAAGGMLEAVDSSGSNIWLSAFSFLVLAVAAVCGAAAFFRSARAAPRF